VGFFVGRDRGDLDDALVVVIEFKKIRIDMHAHRVALATIEVYFYTHDALLSVGVGD
jgi:hypothetical protein